MPPRIHFLRGCVIELRPMIHVRCLWLCFDILAERVVREGGSTRSTYLEMCALFLRNRAPNGTTAKPLCVEERLQLLKHSKHRTQTGPKLHPADIQ
jgi:hypothetical protein